MQQSITSADVIASNTKFGCVLAVDYPKINDLRKKDPKCKFDVTYIPLVFKHVNGKNMKVKIKFSEQLIASNAKIPQFVDEGNIAKCLNVSFINMKQEDIEGGDYTPKQKDNDSDQEKENKRMSGNIARYMENNTTFLKVLDIIDKSYKTVCEDLISKEKTLDFRLKKDRKKTDINVHSIKQDTFFNKESNEDEKLENPIYRLKIPVCRKDGRIGVWSTYYNEFKPTVFDARKMTKKNNYQPVVAKVKVGGKLRDLDVNNASSFIVYKSLVGGTISFDCITASSVGLSLSNSFYDLYVFRHKTKVVKQNISREEIIAMRGGADENEEESDPEVEETKKDGDRADDNEDEDEDEDNEVGDNGNDSNEPHDSDDEVEESNDSPKTK